VLTRLLHRLHVRRQDGFSLVELVVAMMLLGVVVAAFSGLLSATVRSSGRSQELSTLQTEVRAVVDRLAADLRQAQCNGTTPPITTASGTQLTFYSPDRATPYHLRQVAYQLTGTAPNGELSRRFATSTNTGGPPWTIPPLGAWDKQLGSIVNAAPFTYKDETGVATSDPTKVASVNVALTVAPRTGLGGANVTYQTNIDLRTATCA
jgi:prepilin-type N-terminal cleavage/methylation domain-containing protein